MFLVEKMKQGIQDYANDLGLWIWTLTLVWSNKTNANKINMSLWKETKYFERHYFYLYNVNSVSTINENWFNW